MQSRLNDEDRANAFAFAVKDIKTNAQKAGNPLTDSEIAEKLSIGSDEFSAYLTENNVPVDIMIKLITTFDSYSTGKLMGTETEIDPPAPTDPDELEEEG